MIIIKILLLIVKNVFFVLNEGISEKVCQVTRKYTAQAFLALLSGKFRRYKPGHFFFFKFLREAVDTKWC